MAQVQFSINGKRFTVEAGVATDVSLSSYLRKHANLRGSKAMCHEGGCGLCVVSVRVAHPCTGELQIISVNSCLVSIFSCHGWDITTVEGIGTKDQLHPIQARLAAFNGTQCGFCSPGMVMNMYSLQQKKLKMTMKEIENSFGGNICRCTGYRPICDAFKSFAVDVDPKIKAKVQDIEDLCAFSFCKKTGHICTKTCGDYSHEGFCMKDAEVAVKNCDKTQLEIKSGGIQWYKVYSIRDIFNVFEKEGLESYTLVVGNTGQGVYHRKEIPQVMIDISGVAELRQHKLDSDLVLGASMPIVEVMEVFQKIGKENDLFKYTLQMYKHLDQVAHVSVRNYVKDGKEAVYKI